MSVMQCLLRGPASVFSDAGKIKSIMMYGIRRNALTDVLSGEVSKSVDPQLLRGIIHDWRVFSFTLKTVQRRTYALIELKES